MANTADEARQQEGVREKAGATMQQAASTTQEKAQELRSKSADQVRQQLDERTTQAGSQARSVAGALRQSGEQLRGEGNSNAASITDGAAERVERVGDYLERVSGDEMLNDAERFARERPWLLAGIGLFAGLLAARLMKASSERRYGASMSSRFDGGRSLPSPAYPPSTSMESEGMYAAQPQVEGRALEQPEWSP